MTNDFGSFGLSPKLTQALARVQFKVPTPIQAAALPHALAGRDILGSAQTGTGKTAAFGIPMMARLENNPQLAALVLTPTRELATQVMASLQQMIPVSGIRTALLIGGQSMPGQFHQLQAQPRLIVGTPGRINDHLARGSLRLNNVRYVVLDETDRMLDMGFGAQIDKILALVPRERQTLMFSATLPPGIVKLSAKYLTNPERVSVGAMNEAAPNIRQELISIAATEKYQALLAQLKDESGTTLIFVKTKYGTEKLADKLSRLNIRAQAIHGDLKQSRRDRVLQDYRDKRFQVLVATDLAARGLDVPHIQLVINYDMPQCPEDYIHRIGRTARAGAGGKAVNLLTPADGEKWQAIRRLMNPGEAGNESRASNKGQGRGRRRFGNNRRRNGSGSSHPHARKDAQQYAA
jgi:superfamily II DNA/RNA helicase